MNQDHPPASAHADWSPITGAHRKRRRWKDKFREALRGVKFGIRGHSSFAVHFFFAALVIASAFAMQCNPIEWCLLILCIGMVFTSELINSAIESLFHHFDDGTRSRLCHCLDISAGAVLVSAVTAAIIGLIIFVNRLLLILPK